MSKHFHHGTDKSLKKVNKEINQKVRQNTIEGLFIELPDWLYTQHFDIKKKDNARQKRQQKEGL